MAKKMRKFAGGGYENGNEGFDSNPEGTTSSKAAGDSDNYEGTLSSKAAAGPSLDDVAAEDRMTKTAKSEATYPVEKPTAKPTMNMGTAEGFKKFGGTRTEYLNMLNNLKPRAPAAAKAAVKEEEAPAAKSTDASKSRVGILNKMREKDKAIPRGEDYTAAMAKQRASQAEKEPAPKQKSKVLSMQGVNPKTLLGQKTSNFAKGGSVTRGDGCAQRGKTRGMMR